MTTVHGVIGAEPCAAMSGLALLPETSQVAPRIHSFNLSGSVTGLFMNSSRGYTRNNTAMDGSSICG